MKKIQLISANEWRKGHPMEVGAQPSDMYYARLCTELLRVIDRVFNRFAVPDEGQRELALLIGHYVEDVVSGTHIFDSFRKLHTAIYGQTLPFYSTGDDYFDDEVNLLDIKFFIWHHIQKLRGDDKILNPDNTMLGLIADELFPFVCQAYEEAPEVEALHDFVFDKARYTDFIEIKKMMTWLLVSHPITAPDGVLERIDAELERVLDNGYAADPDLIRYGVLAQHLFKTPCNFLALRANEWLAKMLRAEGMDKEAEKLEKCRHTEVKHFEIKGTHGQFVTLKDCETGERYRLLTDSFGDPSVLGREKFMQCDLVTIDGNVWELNGFASFTDKAPEKKQFTIDGKPAYDYYMKKLGGRRIAYYKNKQQLKEQLVGNVPVTMDKAIQGLTGFNDTIVAFLNTDGTVNVSPDLAPTIPDPANPYFEAIDYSVLLGAICSETVASSEMIHYLRQQGWLDGLIFTSVDSPERGRKLLQSDIDFLMRYFRGGEYKPHYE